MKRSGFFGLACAVFSDGDLRSMAIFEGIRFAAIVFSKNPGIFQRNTESYFKTMEGAMCITRRRLLIAGVCTCYASSSWAVLGQPADASNDEGRCFFDSEVSQHAGADVSNGLYRQTSGNPGRDQSISDQLFQTARIFDFTQAELPAFRFIPTNEKGDGFAAETIVDPGTKGFVALNLRLLNGPSSDVMTMIGFRVIMAHEFAHIFQLRKNYIQRFQSNGYHTREIELHADYLAGWCIRQAGEIQNELLEMVANTLFTRGDNNPDIRIEIR